MFSELVVQAFSVHAKEALPIGPMKLLHVNSNLHAV